MEINRQVHGLPMSSPSFPAGRAMRPIARTPEICAVRGGQHTIQQERAVKILIADTKVRENSEEIQAIWEGLPAAKAMTDEYVWERIDQGASSPRCPDGRTREQGRRRVLKDPMADRPGPRAAPVLGEGADADVWR